MQNGQFSDECEIDSLVSKMFSFLMNMKYTNQIKSNQIKKTLLKVIGILHINLLTSIFKQKQQGKKTYTKLKNYIPIGVCTAPWQCKKIPPPHQFRPIIPHVFLAFSLKLEKRTISVGYTKVSTTRQRRHCINVQGTKLCKKGKQSH